MRRSHKQTTAIRRRTARVVATRLLRGGLRALRPGDLRYLKARPQAVLRYLPSPLVDGIAALLSVPVPADREVIDVGGLAQKHDPVVVAGQVYRAVGSVAAVAKRLRLPYHTARSLVLRAATCGLCAYKWRRRRKYTEATRRRVRALASALGVRPAARSAGLPVSTVASMVEHKVRQVPASGRGEQ
ncbi:MAG: hypothetical protein KatS3mg082_1395 [Nitrospiraceae bacterium]|nr:MAG: hypothetical protein KatS3mg082_1395 [Nitrospiraceae bacterium]